MNNDSQLDFLIKNMAREHQPQLPSPSLIWWRAQIQKKLAEKERIERPIMIMRMAAVAVCLGMVLGFVLANWQLISSFVGKGQPGLLLLLVVLAAAVSLFAGSWLFRESAGKS
jgi:hypothetical protein